jgi:hypothetical protein
MTAEAITPNDELTTLSDRELLERVCRQLDHLDQMIHEQGQLIGELRPLLPHVPRVLALLDPGAAMRKKWNLGKGKTSD